MLEERLYRKLLDSAEIVEMYAQQVRSDITDQDTGWYYQFQRSLQNLHSDIRAIKEHESNWDQESIATDKGA